MDTRDDVARWRVCLSGYTVFLVIFVHSCLITLGKKRATLLEQAKKGSLCAGEVLLYHRWNKHTPPDSLEIVSASREAPGSPESVTI